MSLGFTESLRTSLCLLLCYLLTSVQGLPSVSGRVRRAPPAGSPTVPGIVGESATLPCVVHFPGNDRVDFVVQWDRKGFEKPVYIILPPYVPHEHQDYIDRLSLVDDASLRIANLRIEDEGWYECKVEFFNKPDRTDTGNGTWVFLEVHAPPRFTYWPHSPQYYNPGDTAVLWCNATGEPSPNILWRKNGIYMRNGTQTRVYNNILRIPHIDGSTKGVYECVARSAEGESTRVVQVVVAGPPYISEAPRNRSVQTGQTAILNCKAAGHPSNITYQWFVNGHSLEEVHGLKSRITVKPDGALVINPASDDDTGSYSCRASNGIGLPVEAGAWLDIRYSARVTMTESPQYLPKGLPGVVRCHIKAHPPVQFVTWFKDLRVISEGIDGIKVLRNGSLLIEKADKSNEGKYACTPYNEVGTAGTSDPILVAVKDPPRFVVGPAPVYQRTEGSEVIMPCAATGDPAPTVQWKRAGGLPLPPQRWAITNGNLTIFNMKKEDNGEYDCLASSPVLTIVATARLMVLHTTPHAPMNVTVSTAVFSATIRWVPAFDGGHPQSYVLWYKKAEETDKEWKKIDVRPGNATTFTVYSLTPNTKYEFAVGTRNIIGTGSFSASFVARTKTYESLGTELPTDAYGSTFIPPIMVPMGPTPDKPYDVRVSASHNDSGIIVQVRWRPPKNLTVPVVYYVAEYKANDADWAEPWTHLGPRLLHGQTQASSLTLSPDKTYRFRVFAFTLTAFSEPSETVVFTVPAKPFQFGKAGIAGLIGGISFLVVTGLLALIATCLCNRRSKRRKRKRQNQHQHQYDHLNSTPIPMTNLNGPTTIGNHVPNKKTKKTNSSSVSLRHLKSKVIAMRYAIQLSKVRRDVGGSLDKRHTEWERHRVIPRHPHYRVSQRTLSIGTVRRDSNGKFVLDIADSTEPARVPPSSRSGKASSSRASGRAREKCHKPGSRVRADEAGVIHYGHYNIRCQEKARSNELRPTHISIQEKARCSNDTRPTHSSIHENGPGPGKPRPTHSSIQENGPGPGKPRPTHISIHENGPGPGKPVGRKAEGLTASRAPLDETPPTTKTLVAKQVGLQKVLTSPCTHNPYLHQAALEPDTGTCGRQLLRSPADVESHVGFDNPSFSDRQVARVPPSPQRHQRPSDGHHASGHRPARVKYNDSSYADRDTTRSDFTTPRLERFAEDGAIGAGSRPASKQAQRHRRGAPKDATDPPQENGRSPEFEPAYLNRQNVKLNSYLHDPTSIHSPPPGCRSMTSGTSGYVGSRGAVDARYPTGYFLPASREQNSPSPNDSKSSSGFSSGATWQVAADLEPSPRGSLDTPTACQHAGLTSPCEDPYEFDMISSRAPSSERAISVRSKTYRETDLEKDSHVQGEGRQPEYSNAAQRCAALKEEFEQYRQRRRLLLQQEVML
ncbi:PREDICTED: protein turtle homolog A-like [Priapulus caudatus]|uniref:Protein turtle homolog A-like n=1 Tax=Priapulus caudatus TaxID=37621 RepID=A0ABM1EF41_PRICU|nr:PREDICTED: protein turtle homolog A-like [Priapulus caudatus]XP_014670818.1 PREDICTED: protein turtle homolog A-like [Priapulus caudatus]